jgi:hypothetical protein
VFVPEDKLPLIKNTEVDPEPKAETDSKVSTDTNGNDKEASEDSTVQSESAAQEATSESPPVDPAFNVNAPKTPESDSTTSEDELAANKIAENKQTALNKDDKTKPRRVADSDEIKRWCGTIFDLTDSLKFMLERCAKTDALFEKYGVFDLIAEIVLDSKILERSVDNFFNFAVVASVKHPSYVNALYKKVCSWSDDLHIVLT